ncbi:Glycerol kinase [Streptomyces violaceorubidus]
MPRAAIALIPRAPATPGGTTGVRLPLDEGQRSRGCPAPTSINAIVWQDTRTDALCRELGRNVGQDRFRRETGLPLASYFAGPKARWLLDNVDGLRERAEAGDLLFGTMDTWVIWNLTGGVNGGKHVTDVTNASRTMLMNLHTMAWDEKIAESIGVPMQMLPEIRSSAEVYGEITGGRLGELLGGIPVASALGDQQAALFGQTCFSEGETKSTYGTGTFMVMNTGDKLINSYSGLLTTVGYKIGDQDAVTPWRARSPSPVRWSSGCATRWA